MIKSGRTRQVLKIVISNLIRISGNAHSVPRRIHSSIGWFGWFILLALAVAATTGVWSLVHFWDWLQTGDGGRETGSTTVRNIGLLVAGLIALPVALWRSIVAQRQAEAAQRQAVTAQQDLLNERYQQGAEMLGSRVPAVRLGGIYALERLATENPAIYYIQITRLLSAFIRHPTQDEQSQSRQVSRGKPIPREDVEAAARSLSECHIRQLSVLGYPKRRLNLTNSTLAGANLRHIVLAQALLDDANLSSATMNFATLPEVQFLRTNLVDADLSNADLTGARFLAAKLSNARLSFAEAPNAEFTNTDLSSAWLAGTNLSGAKLYGSNFAGTILLGVNLSGADLSAGGNSPAIGLTQDQMDEARADRSNPPKLDGVVDANTGKPLVWRGRTPFDAGQSSNGSADST